MLASDLKITDRIRFRWRTFSGSTFWMEDSAVIKKIDDFGLWVEMGPFLMIPVDPKNIICKEVPIEPLRPMECIFTAESISSGMSFGYHSLLMQGQVGEHPEIQKNVSLPIPRDNRFGEIAPYQQFKLTIEKIIEPK